MGELLKSGDCLSENNTKTLSTLDERSKDFQKRLRSEATKEAYSSDWKAFTDWASGLDLDFLPARPSTVRRYITHLAHDRGRAASTISRALTSIRQAHQTLELTNPTISPEVVETWKGIKRELGTAQKRAKPLLLADLRKVIDGTRPTFLGRRDAALLLVGWAAALRRSEIIALDFEHVEFVPEGMIITIPKSKTDQEGEGYRLGIPLAREERFCPTKRLEKWITLARIESGPLFFAIGTPGKKWIAKIDERRRIAPRLVNAIIKRRLERAGFTARGYSGHSLRAGFVTSAATQEMPEYLIQIHTRHRTTKVLREYIRQGNLFTLNPLSTLL